ATRAGAEAFHRGHDNSRVEPNYRGPSEAHAIEGTGGKILNQHIAMLDQLFQYLLALLALGIERHRALVVVEHREIQPVHVWYVTQLFTRDVPRAGLLDLDDIGT